MCVSASPDTRLSRRHRIVKSSSIREALESDSRYVGRLMVACIRVGADAGLRLGVVAGKRSFRKAHDRTRAKRLLREAYRLNRFRLRGECDVVLVARRPILEVSRRDVEKELIRLMKKAGLFAGNPMTTDPMSVVV